MTEPQDERFDKSETPAPTPYAPSWAPPHQPIVGGYAPPDPRGYPPPWPQPNYGFTPPPHPNNELGIASLILGILALVFFWFPFVGVILGGCAVAMGIAARRRIKRGEADNNGSTIAGIVLGIVAFLISGLISALISVAFISYQDCIQHAEGRYEYGQC